MTERQNINMRNIFLVLFVVNIVIPKCIFITITASRLFTQKQEIRDFKLVKSSPLTKCKENFVFDNDDIYRLNCTDDQSFYSISQTCVSKEATKALDERLALGLSERPLCKNITLHPSEYKLDEHGNIFINVVNVTFPQGHYNIEKSNQEVKVCFPFEADFIRCQRWLLYEDEFELRHHGLVLWSCMEQMLYQPGEFYIKDSNEAVTCMVLANDTESMQDDMFNIGDIYASASAISALTIFLSIFIYFLTQKLRRDHTKILMNHMISLFFFYLTFVVRWWGPWPSYGLCLAYAIILHYSFLASFFWINIFSFNIWKGLTNSPASRITSSSCRYIFLCVSLYGWGCPLIISVAAILADHFDNFRFKPAFSQSCWFGTVEGKALFMYGPAALLIAANVIFFILTVIKLRSFSKGVAIANKKIHVQLLIMSSKLLVLMGFCWITEIISALLGEEYHKLFYFTDTINSLQGFFYFLIYICKRSIFRDIRYWHYRRMSSRRNLQGSEVTSSTNSN